MARSCQIAVAETARLPGPVHHHGGVPSEHQPNDGARARSEDPSILLSDGPAPSRLSEGAAAAPERARADGAMSRAAHKAQAERLRDRGFRRTTPGRADRAAWEWPAVLDTGPHDPAGSLDRIRFRSVTRPRRRPRRKPGRILSPPRPAPPRAPRRCRLRGRCQAPPRPNGASPEAGSRAGRTTSRRRAR
jgi:hypothetical protein